jgi:NADPH:quinone reductase
MAPMTVPATMTIIQHAPQTQLALEQAPVPAAPPGKVLIAVAAAGVNRPDLLQRAGLYPPPPGASAVLGLEVAGAVVAVGDGVARWKIGDQVCALLSGGGYASYALADAGACLPIPAGVSAVDAASLPETVFTVWANVFEAGALKPGETFLVHGGASGIGAAAIQMAAAHGAKVYATAGDAAKCSHCEKLGATRAINYRDEDFETVLREAGGVDVILDMVGAPYLAKNLNILNERGRLVYIAFLHGARAEIDLMRVMLKKLTITGSTLRNRPDTEKARIAAAVEQTVWPWLASGKVKAAIDSVFPFSRAEEAHARMTASSHAGKIMLVPDHLA